MSMEYLLKELTRHRSRTISSISGYCIATLFIMLILSVTSTSENDSFAILKGTGTHFITYIPSKASCCTIKGTNSSVFADGVSTQMLPADLIQKVKAVKGVREAAPYLLFEMFDTNFNKLISIGGIDTSNVATKTNVCAATNVIEGTFITGNKNEIVSEESFAMAHNLEVGDTLNIFNGKMILAGIINSGIKPGKADFYSSIENVRNILRDNLHCESSTFDMNIILVEVSDARIQQNVIDQLKKEMAYLTVSSYNCFEPASKVISITKKSSAILSIMIFVFLIIFSIKTQLASLIERYREIGILKSLGWSSSRLSRQILITSLIQSIIGAFIGVVLGVIVIMIMNNFNIRFFESLELHFQLKSIPFVILLSILGGLIAGYFPVIKLHRTKAGDMMNNYL
jgi:ABC-type lipoprotein release transport system permease subunit